MPEEIAIIVVISIAAGTFLAFVKAILGYLSSKRQAQTQEGSSMTTSELERLIRTAVTDANAPILDRLEALERASAARQLPSGERIELEDLDEAEEAAARVRVERRRIR